MRNLPLILSFAIIFGLLTSVKTDISNSTGSCPKNGRTKSGGTPKPNFQALNAKKNRNTVLSTSDFASTVTLNDMMSSGDVSSKFDESRAVTIEGYILKAKDEEGESCNCYSAAAQDHDIHVYIAPTDPQMIGQCAVVELTQWTKRQHPQWTSNYINTNLAHHKVKVSGWLLYDFEHRPASYQSHPELTTNRAQRYTVWEIHPITDIALVNN